MKYNLTSNCRPCQAINGSNNKVDGHSVLSNLFAFFSYHFCISLNGFESDYKRQNGSKYDFPCVIHNSRCNVAPKFTFISFLQSYLDRYVLLKCTLIIIDIVANLE